MSGSGDDQGGAGRREVAYRLFAAEFEDADFSYSESDEERAPNYVVTPSGARVNRLFAVGVLTEVEPAGEDILRARVVDPTGAFVVYAGQYQPEAQAFFERAEPPAFVAVTGKARTFQPDDADVTYTSVRPENVNEVTAETRDRWSVQTARQTLDRVATMAGALAREERGDDLRRALEAEGVDVGLAAGIPLAIDHYGTTPAYLAALRDLSTEVAEVVAGERDEVDAFTTNPDAPGEADLAALAGQTVTTSAGADADDAVAETAAGGETTTVGATSDSAADAGADSASAGGDAAAETSETGVADDGAVVDATAESGATAAESEPAETDAVDAGERATETDVSGAETADATGETRAASEASDADGDDIGDFEPGEFDLDDDEREAIEEEYGTDFQSGTEVDEPGEADIETPDPEGVEAESEPSTDAAGTDSAATGSQSTESTDAETTAGSDASGTSADQTGEASASASTADEAVTADDTTDEESDTAADDEPAEDVDLETAVMDAMRDNDDGEGASEAAIVDAVTDRLGVDAAAVEDAIQDALMGGQCYEPEDGVYKPI